MMLTNVATEFIANGISGRSKALVAALTAALIAEKSVENDEIRIYVNDAPLVSGGTNVEAKDEAAEQKITERRRPRRDWVYKRVYVRFMRD